ncbi:MAG: hypothetical protein A2Z64_08005 [Betaproteobacteria bacterium RIFCSPLOWO2_02_67_12]|nr:MAG: hypothetical protein A2Z64_08005 [Betaproteobacteria bacterium RIFCSPLOWO2_02_67_12]OGA60482.1 MAG: hypothetical protein A3F77_17425 [Betaproteobacteria bacterium RIFCSPLOWO2_12_FULL_67_28]
MRKCVIALACAAALAAGCASYDGRTLVPGRSTAAEVEATMGRPAEKMERAGDSIWWYPRGPLGFHSYAVYIGPDGLLRRIEQRLTLENVQRLVPGSTTRKDVRELFGPPFVVSRLPRLQREVWEYQLLDVVFRWKLWVQFSDDGVVREVLQMRHPDEDPPGDATKD